MSRSKKTSRDAGPATTVPPRVTGRQKLLLAVAVGLELAWLATLIVLARL